MILGYDTDHFKCTEHTHNFVVFLFGFFPYAREQDINNFFFNELGIKDNFQRNVYNRLKDFSFSGNTLLDTYNMVGGGTFDAGFLLPFSFKSYEEAERFIQDKIRGSKFVNTNLFTEISILDQDVLQHILSEKNKEWQEQKRIAKKVTEEINTFLSLMDDKYGKDSPVALKIHSKLH